MKNECPIVFTTAYDHYAIKAFKLDSIDYLLKPIDEDELKIAQVNVDQITQKEAETNIKITNIEQ